MDLRVDEKVEFEVAKMVPPFQYIRPPKCPRLVVLVSYDQRKKDKYNLTRQIRQDKIREIGQ